MAAWQASRGSGESLPREERLRRRAEYQRCYRRGRRRQGSLIVLYAVRAEGPAVGPRLGVTVSRKVGGAVVRSRTKRRIREIYRRWRERKRLPAVDLVAHAKPAAGRADFRALEAEFARLLGTLIPPANRVS